MTIKVSVPTVQNLSCSFCNDLIRNRSFIETNDCFVFLAKHAIHRGQSLVIPKRHVSTISELSEAEFFSLMLSAKEAIKVLKNSGISDDFNLVINDGMYAGQTVQHVHLHIIPRIAGDVAEPKRWLSDGLFEILKEVSTSELEDTAHWLSKKMLSFTEKTEYWKSYTMGSSQQPPKWLKITQPCNIEDGVIFGNCSSDFLNLDSFTDITIDFGANIRSGSIIYRGVQIGKNFDCGHNVLIRDGTNIGHDVYVYSGTQIHKDVQIGNNCVIAGWLGNNSVVENYVKMFGQLIHGYESERGSIQEPAPIIRTGAFVGWNSIVIGGVEIGCASVVGAGSTVTSDVEAKAIVAGIPARDIGEN